MIGQTVDACARLLGRLVKAALTDDGVILSCL